MSLLTGWIGLIGRFIFAIFGAVFLALGIALYPVGCLIPSWVGNFAFQCAFKIGYQLYVFTPLGRMIHLQMINSRRKGHTQPHTINITATSLSTCDVIPVPILADNYGYMIIDRATKQAAVVDPADPRLMEQMLERRKVQLTTILTTHRHHDHAGGNLDLKKKFPGVVVVGGKGDNVAGVTKEVSDGDRLSIGETLVQIIETPCHTAGHVVFVVCGRGGAGLSEVAEGVFSGDTLFIGGVGAFFHGSENDMHKSINQNLSWVPDSALVFCGHEYTVENCRFAEWLEPGNPLVLARASWAVKRRAMKEPTVPCPLGEERSLNPFMRVRDPAFANLATRRLNATEKKSWWKSADKADEYRADGASAQLNNNIFFPTENGDVEAADDSTIPQSGLLPDDQAVKVMKKLHGLMRIWSQSPEHQHQLPPCCVHGSCLRRVTCSGQMFKGAQTRSQGAQCEPCDPDDDGIQPNF